jgi:hypothetical protein
VDEDEDALVHGRRKRKVAFIPSLGRVLPDMVSPWLLIIVGRHNSHNLLPWTLAKSMYSTIITFSDVLGELIHLVRLKITRTKRHPDYGHGASLKIR